MSGSLVSAEEAQRLLVVLVRAHEDGSRSPVPGDQDLLVKDAQNRTRTLVRNRNGAREGAHPQRP